MVIPCTTKVHVDASCFPHLTVGPPGARIVLRAWGAVFDPYRWVVRWPPPMYILSGTLILLKSSMQGIRIGPSMPHIIGLGGWKDPHGQALDVKFQVNPIPLSLNPWHTSLMVLYEKKILVDSVWCPPNHQSKWTIQTLPLTSPDSKGIRFRINLY